MRNIWIVMKKELARVFQDKKLIFTILILPGLILFVVYTLTGKAMSGVTSPQEYYEIYQTGLPEPTKEQISNYYKGDANITINFVDVDTSKIEETINKVKDDEILLYLIFSEENSVFAMYFNEQNLKSFVLVQLTMDTLEYTEAKLLIENQEVEVLSMSVSSEEGSNVLAMILPMLIIVFLFQGALAVGPESIAGDKERGTIATLLATPTKRSEIAMGKIFSLSILAVLASLSSFIGIMASFPSMVGMDDIQVNYSFTTYVYLLVILVTSVIFITSIISVISAFAKTVKEATSLSAPVMLISLGAGIMMMFDSGRTPSKIIYLIPIYNTALLLKDAFSANITLVNLLIGSISNLAFTAAFIYILTRMFNSEKRMFTK